MADTTSLKLPGDLKGKIATLASECEQTPHAYMVEAIAEKVARDEKRRELYDAARESAAEFQRTGIAYAHDDVMKHFIDIASGKKPRKLKPIRIPRSRR